MNMQQKEQTFKKILGIVKHLNGAINYDGLELNNTDVFWYDQEDVVTVTLPQGKLVFSACGETYFRYKGEHVSEKDLISLLKLKTDEDVKMMWKDPEFDAENNNWIEFSVFDANGDIIDSFTVDDTDDFIEAIFNVINDKEWLSEIFE